MTRPDGHPLAIGYGGVRYVVTARDADGNSLLISDPHPATGQLSYLRRDAAGNVRPWSNPKGWGEPLDPPGGGWWSRVADDRPIGTPRVGWGESL